MPRAEVLGTTACAQRGHRVSVRHSLRQGDPVGDDDLQARALPVFVLQLVPIAGQHIDHKADEPNQVDMTPAATSFADHWSQPAPLEPGAVADVPSRSSRGITQVAAGIDQDAR